MENPLNYTKFIIQATNLYTRMNAFKPEAVLAVAMLTAHESAGGTHWKQQENGPARGVIQMEKLTHDSILSLIHISEPTRPY